MCRRCRRALRPILKDVLVPEPGRSRYPLMVMGEEIDVDSPLAGRHQLRNLALAIATAEELAQFGFKVTPQANGAGNSRDPLAGPFSGAATVGGDPSTRDGARCGAQSGRRLGFAIGAVGEFFRTRVDHGLRRHARQGARRRWQTILFPIAEQVIVTRVANPRAATTSELLQAASRTGTPLVRRATR